MKKKILLASTIFMVGFLYILSSPDEGRKMTDPDKAEATVMITNLKKNSGGTGVILSSSLNRSDILTNKHVCKLIQYGGWVKTDAGSTYAVSSYKESEYHDLCLVSVIADLHINTLVSKRNPREYEGATISGHPLLYPTIITKGNFGKKTSVTVMMGIRKCTDEELQDPKYGFMCLFNGGLPILKQFEAQVISATIQPGSSGSAVYNSDGEVSALVFAGQGGLGYALSIPIGFISRFLKVEIPVLPVILPSPKSDSEDIESSSTEYNCGLIKDSALNLVCKIKNLLLRNRYDSTRGNKIWKTI